MEEEGGKGHGRGAAATREPGGSATVEGSECHRGRQALSSRPRRPRRLPMLLPLLLLLAPFLQCLVAADSNEPPVTALQPGVRVDGSVAAKTYAYYEIAQSPESISRRDDLLVTATAMSGDPDLYLTLKGHLPFPSNARFEWTATHLGQDSIIIPAEDKNNCLNQPSASRGGCVYRIAVFGYQPSRFTLVARFNSSEPLPLTLGQPQSDQVLSGTLRQFGFDITPEVMRMPDGMPADLQVLVTPLNGDPDVYATLGPAPGVRPSSDAHDFKSVSWGQSQDRIVLRPTDPAFQQRCPQTRCRLRVGVYGFHDAAFSILLSTHAAPVLLQENVPFQNAGLPPGEYQRFSIPWHESGAEEDVVVTLTKQAGGRLRLFASCRSPSPNADATDSDSQWTMDTGVGSTLRIGKGEGKQKGCEAGSVLALAVLADGDAAAFSLLVSTDAPTSVPLLVPGLPTYGQVSYNTMAYFSIRTGGASYEDMDVLLTPRSGGEADLFLSLDWEHRPRLDPVTGQVTSAVLSSVEDGEDRLAVRHKRFPACNNGGNGGGCVYILGVLGRRRGTNAFSLVASAVDATVTLVEGVAVRDAVGSKNYNYYIFTILDVNTDVSISVTPFSGDPDLYAAFGKAKPTKEDHAWASRGFGADTLTIQAAAIKEHCAPNPEFGEGCALNIGVNAWSNTSYSILATLNRGWASPIELAPGQPQTGTVAKSMYAYYSVKIPGSVSGEQRPVVRVTLLPAGGKDQDLYVSLSREKEPGKDAYDFKSTSWSSSDEVVIAPGDPKYNCTDPVDGCTAYIAVFGYDAGEFTITASLSTRQQELQLGSPVLATVGANGTNFYQIGWSGSDLLVSLHPLGGSKPELYLSCRHPYPNATAHTWGLRSREAQVLRINATEAEGDGVSGGRCHWPGRLWLAVVSEVGRGMATYSLTVATDTSTTMPVLLPGVPLAGDTPLNKFTYYQLRGMAGGYEDFDVIVTVTAGEVDLYVSNSIAGRPVWDPTRATVANYTLKSEQRGSDRVRIRHSHFTEDGCGTADGGKGECVYVVGVLGRGLVGRNAYSIVAKKRASTVELTDGLAVRDFVKPDRYEYFTFKVTDAEADLTVAVTPFTGDPDVYVSPAPHRPNITNHEWSATGFGRDSLTIQAEELKEHCTPDPVRGVACEYFIGVYGWTNTSFSVLASLNRGWQDPTWLFPGQSQAGQVSEGGYQYYQYYVPADTKELRFVLTPAGIGGGNIADDILDDWDAAVEEPDQDLFLSTSREKQPGETSFDLTSNEWAGVDEIVYSAEEVGAEAWCTDCLVYLSVYGASGEAGQYTLRVETGVTELQSAVPVTGHVTTGSSNVYKLWNGDTQAKILISATTLSGDADIFVMAETFTNDSARVIPGRAQYHWKSSRVGDDVVEILPSDQHFCSDCSYIITVEGWSNTSYTLTATVEALAMVPLAGGRPQTSFVDAQQIKYFSAVLGSSAEDLRVSLTVLSGAAELYVGEDVNHPPLANDSSTYRYTTHGKGGRGGGSSSQSLVVPGPHRNRTRFAMGVVGLEDGTVFSLTASFSQMPLLLQEGVPLQQTVAAGRNEFFVYRVSRHEDVTISVTALQGDPDILASTTGPERPMCTRARGADPWSFECGNYTWIAQSFASDELTILHDAPCEAVGSTRVYAARCRPQDALAPGKLLHVTVFGYDEVDTTFTITLTTGGGRTKLLPGQPQHGTTRSGAICRTRSEAGACDTSDAGARGTQWDRASVAYFQFLVAPPNALFGEKDAHVSLVLEPQCNATVRPCAPGCPCDPLTVFVTSCPESRCTVDEEYPSPFHFQLQQQATSAYSTLFIARDPLNPGNGFCDPKAAGEPCLYYVTVFHPGANSGDESSSGGGKGGGVGFTLTASTPSDVTVLPTRTRPAAPDGVVTSSLATVDESGSKKYQMYAQPRGGAVLLTLEACTGELSLAVCDGSCRGVYPTEADYGYFADATRACTRSGCRPAADLVPRIGLDRAEGNAYFVAVNGSGTFRVRAETTDPATGKAIAPLLAPPSHAPTLSFRDVGTDHVTITWHAATLTMPGRPGSKRAVAPADVRYRVYALEEGRIEEAAMGGGGGGDRPVLHTVCGLEHFASATAGKGGTRVGLAEGGATSYVMTGLTPGQQYRFFVSALCDAACLRAAAHTKEAGPLSIPCGGAVPCQDQNALYAPAQLAMPGSAAAARWRRLLGVGGLSLTATLLILGLAMALVTAGVLWRQDRRLEEQLSYEMTNSPRGESPVFGLSTGSGGAVGSGAGGGDASRGGRYERLLAEGDRGEEMVEGRFASGGYRLTTVHEEEGGPEGERREEEDTALV